MEGSSDGCDQVVALVGAPIQILSFASLNSKASDAWTGVKKKRGGEKMHASFQTCKTFLIKTYP